MSPGPGGRADWLRQLVRVSHTTSVSLDRIVLAAVGVTLPVGLALLLAPNNSALVGAGSLASMGALLGSIMDHGDAGIERVNRMAIASVLGGVGFAIGTAVHGHAAATFLARCFFPERHAVSEVYRAIAAQLVAHPTRPTCASAPGCTSP